MTLHEHVVAAARQLRDAGIGARAARLDAEVLARHALGWDLTTYLLNRHEPPPTGFVDRYQPLVRRRSAREPVSIITGRREFWGLELEVTTAVLTPRPESELIIEEALALAGHGSGCRWSILDVGTGSGCLALALAVELPLARLAAVDVSAEALAVARRNAERHGLANRVAWLRSDLLAGIRGTFDLIVSNPPYVPAGAAGALAPEVRDFEPPLALYGGTDGLAVLRKLVSQAATRLTPGGHLVVEFGAGQDTPVCEMVAAHPALAVATIRSDLQGLPRVIVARRA